MSRRVFSRLSRMFCLTSPVLSLLPAWDTSATTYSWTGAVDTAWLVPENWQATTVPGQNDLAKITTSVAEIGIDFGLPTNNGIGNQVVGGIDYTFTGAADGVRITNSSPTQSGVLTIGGVGIGPGLLRAVGAGKTLTIQPTQSPEAPDMDLVLERNLTVDASNTTSTVIVDCDVSEYAPASLTKRGTGKLVLGRTFNLSAGLQIERGTVELSPVHGSAFASPVKFANSSPLAPASVLRLFLLNKNVDIPALETVLSTSLPNVFVENGSLSDGTLHLSMSTSQTFGGVLRDGDGGGALWVTKFGTESTWTLSGVNLHTGGTSVREGTLALRGTSNNIAQSPMIVVADGAFLDVTGLTEGFTLGENQRLGGSGRIIGSINNTNGTISPGESPGHMLIEGDALFSGGTQSTLRIEFTGSSDSPADPNSGGVSFDLLEVTGSLSIDHARLECAVGDVLHPVPLDGVRYYQPYTVARASEIVGMFDELNDLIVSTGRYRRSYPWFDVSVVRDQDGDRLTITFVPEPAFAGITFTSMLMARRRKPVRRSCCVAVQQTLAGPDRR